jgi:outer membrane putative beta-barrel porin/alpha-amylase
VRRTASRVRLAAGCLAALATAASAADPVPDKSRYTIFDPTPREQMREMSTDRPDKTESAYTVDAGHFQVEMDLVTYARDRYTSDHTDVDAFPVAPMNLKVGLTNWTDLQVVLETYKWVRTEDRIDGDVTHSRGFGDVTLRLKTNLWGNDENGSAFAVMPFVKLPTNQDGLGNDAVEGGLILPFDWGLPWEWAFGGMAVFGAIEDGDGRGHHAEFVQSITLDHDVVGDLAGYAELFSLSSTEAGSHWQSTADFGLTYRLTQDIQLDGGVNVGLTRAADDVNPFLGLSFRL